jgi:PTS system ascorbate-specific IIA component
MLGFYLIAHAPLASALRELALHTFPEVEAQVAAYDMPPDRQIDQYVEEIEAELARLGWTEVLLLTDVLGGSPANATAKVARRAGRRAVAGLNVPMLWRALNYRSLPIDELAVRARDGGLAGIQSVSPPAPQNQTLTTPSHDSRNRHHQQ